MSRQLAALGVGAATLFGIATAYSTFQPELIRQREERQGIFRERPVADDQLSQAIFSDLKAAGQEIQEIDRTGWAWGYKQLLLGKKKVPNVSTADAVKDAASAQSNAGVSTAPSDQTAVAVKPA